MAGRATQKATRRQRGGVKFTRSRSQKKKTGSLRKTLAAPMQRGFFPKRWRQSVTAARPAGWSLSAKDERLAKKALKELTKKSKSKSKKPVFAMPVGWEEAAEAALKNVEEEEELAGLFGSKTKL